ncbi:unnamed protein product [Sphagnum balticum]
MKSLDERVQNNYSKLVRELCRLFPSPTSKRAIPEPSDDLDDDFDSATEPGEQGSNGAREFKRQRREEPHPQTDDDDAECWNDRTDEDVSGEEPTVFECGLCFMSLVDIR